jgi:hypothetical protein
MAATFLAPLITIDARTREVLMITPQAATPRRANQ